MDSGAKERPVHYIGIQKIIFKIFLQVIKEVGGRGGVENNTTLLRHITYRKKGAVEWIYGVVELSG